MDVLRILRYVHQRLRLHNKVGDLRQLVFPLLSCLQRLSDACMSLCIWLQSTWLYSVSLQHSFDVTCFGRAAWSLVALVPGTRQTMCWLTPQDDQCSLHGTRATPAQMGWPCHPGLGSSPTGSHDDSDLQRRRRAVGHVRRNVSRIMSRQPWGSAKFLLISRTHWQRSVTGHAWGGPGGFDVNYDRGTKGYQAAVLLPN